MMNKVSSIALVAPFLISAVAGQEAPERPILGGIIGDGGPGLGSLGDLLPDSGVVDGLPELPEDLPIGDGQLVKTAVGIGIVKGIANGIESSKKGGGKKGGGKKGNKVKGGGKKGGGKKGNKVKGGGKKAGGKKGGGKKGGKKGGGKKGDGKKDGKKGTKKSGNNGGGDRVPETPDGPSVPVDPSPGIPGLDESQLPEPTQTITELALNDPELSILVELLESQDDLLETILGDGPFTILAPVDSAFEELFGSVDPATVSATILENILEYHVLNGRFLASAFSDGILVQSLNNNGLVVDVDAATGSITLNEDASVIEANLLATNGVIHKIDAVLDVPGQTIVGVAGNFGIFNTLLLALQATGLDSPLANPAEGPFTVVAPTDEAFAKLGDIDSLLKEDLPTLEAILSYHVIPGLFGAGDLTRISALPTLEGSLIEVGTNGTTLNNGIHIIDFDNLATNGVVHAIDTVLSIPE